jgi:hypothetical protein
LNRHLQFILNSIQQSEHLNTEEKNALIIAINDADKEFAISEFKLDRTEKVKTHYRDSIRRNYCRTGTKKKSR